MTMDKGIPPSSLAICSLSLAAVGGGGGGIGVLSSTAAE